MLALAIPRGRPGRDWIASSVRGAMGACQCATKKKMIFSYFRVEICSVCPVVRAGVEHIDRVGSDGCTVSVTVLPEKKMIF